MSQKTPNEGQFDCMAFKRDVQSKIYGEIKDLSAREEIAYFRRSVETGPFARLWRSVASARTRRPHIRG